MAQRDKTLACLPSIRLTILQDFAPAIVKSVRWSRSAKAIPKVCNSHKHTWEAIAEHFGHRWTHPKGRNLGGGLLISARIRSRSSLPGKGMLAVETSHRRWQEGRGRWQEGRGRWQEGRERCTVLLLPTVLPGPIAPSRGGSSLHATART